MRARELRLRSIRRNPYSAPMGRSMVTAAFERTLDLYQTGVDLMRQNLRRANPEASDAEIDLELGLWLQHRPGAELGDCPGRPRDISGLVG